MAGNCFSLQKEHDIAIRYFQRAVQVDPLFAYAYTLLGHEYVLVDELDKALAAFRNALRLDVRHYNAWYVSHWPSSFCTVISIDLVYNLPSVL